MNAHDHRFLLSERAALTGMLSEIAPDSVITRMSLESRLQEVEEQIAAFEAAPTRLVETRIAFRGAPVGDDGIEAGFAVKALGAFTDAVATVGVGHALGLPLSGRARDKVAYNMVVRHTFPGSFGFRVEREFPHGAPPEEPAALESAIERVKAIVEASADNDESLSNAVAETDEKSIRSVRKFLAVMEKAKAYCSIAFKGDQFLFRDAAHVRESATRMAPNNIRESSEEMAVMFTGVLPNTRRYEFVTRSGEVMTGAVAKSLRNIKAINEALGKPATVFVKARRVGESKPTYIITGWEPA